MGKFSIDSRIGWHFGGANDWPFGGANDWPFATDNFHSTIASDGILPQPIAGTGH